MGKYVVLVKDDRNPLRVESKWIEVEAENLNEAIGKGRDIFFGRYPGEPVREFSPGFRHL